MNMITHGNYSHGLLPGTRYALGCAHCQEAKRTEESDESSGRWIIATGLPGYGPDASDGNYTVATSWTALASAISYELDQLADFTYEGASAYADQEDYKAAWLAMKESEALSLLSATFDNSRMHAPLYAGNPQLWHDTVRRLAEEHFPYDVADNLRLYVWPDSEFGADEDEES